MTDRKRRQSGIRTLKNEAPRILSEVREEEAEYFITHRGKPVAVIRPWSAEDERDERASRARDYIASVDDFAKRVAERAGKKTAAAAVSGQRH